MAGVLGVVTRGREPVDLPAGLRSLCHAPWFEGRAVVQEPRLALGVAHRPQDGDLDEAFDDVAGVGAIVYGWVVGDRPTWRRYRAHDVIATYLRGGTGGLRELDGGFVVALVDLRARRLLLLNDRMATIPVQMLAEGGRFAFAPEAKAIRGMLARPLRLQESGMVSFLAAGHALADETLFEGIRLLDPAQLVDVSLDDARVTQTSSWNLRFSPRRSLTEREAGDRLYDAFLECHRALLDEPQRVRLLLSGGVDSRTILATLSRAGRPPEETISWGVRGDIPSSDPVVAAALATQYGVPFRFVGYDADTFAEHAAEWAWISELAWDNLGCFASGKCLLTEDPESGSILLIGDEMVGVGGWPLDRRDAIEAAVGLPLDGLPSVLGQVMPPERHGDLAELLTSRLKACADRCPHDHPKDLHDYLRWSVTLARRLNAPAPFREPMVSARRPMLLAPAVDLFQELPPALRVHKRSLLAMQRRRMPDVLEVPTATANSLVDWDRAFSTGGVAAGLFRDLVDDGVAALENVHVSLDLRRMREAVARYCDQPRRAIDRRPSSNHLLSQLRRATSRSRLASVGLRHAERWARHARKRPVGPSEGRVVIRVALLGLLDRRIRSLRFDGEVGTPRRSDAAWDVRRWLDNGGSER